VSYIYKIYIYIYILSGTLPFLSSSTRTLFVGFCPVVKSVYQSSTRAVDTYLHRGGASSFFFFLRKKRSFTSSSEWRTPSFSWERNKILRSKICHQRSLISMKTFCWDVKKKSVRLDKSWFSITFLILVIVVGISSGDTARKNWRM